MSRNGQGYKYAHGVIGSGFGTALRTNMAANLSNWTVGSLYTFGAGSEERNYFVLTHATSSAEILICAPNGTTSSYFEYVNAAWRIDTGEIVGGDTNQRLIVAFSPGGGYLAALVAAKDPANADFWPSSSSKGIPIGWTFNGTDVDFYFITDDAKAEFCFYLKSNSNTTMAFFLAGDEVFDNTYNTTTISQAGLVSGYNANAGGFTTIAEMIMQWSFWASSGAYTTIDYSELGSYSFLNGSVDSNEPDSQSGKFYTSTIPILGPNGMLGHIASDVMKICGRTNTDTFKTLRGSDPYYYHVFRDLYTPWDNLLALPT